MKNKIKFLDKKEAALSAVAKHVNRVLLVTANLAFQASEDGEKEISNKLLEADYLIHKGREILMELFLNEEDIKIFKEKAQGVYKEMSDLIHIGYKQ